MSAETLAAADETFDVVLAMEVVEHVTDLGLFIETAASMVKPGGILFVGGKAIEIDSPVEYVVTLASGNSGVVNLRCMGKVLRLQEFLSEEPEVPSIVVAVSLERYEFQRCKHKSLSQAEVA